MTDLARQACLHALGDLRAAPSAGARRAVFQRLAARFDVHEATARAWCAELGWKSGRAVRKDAGARAEGLAADALTVSKRLAACRSKDGKNNQPMKEAHRLAQEEGLEIGGLSYTQFVRTLNGLGLGLTHLSAPTASIANVSTYPNQTWVFDISVCSQWHFRDTTTGKRLAQHSNAAAIYYPGKPGNFDASQPVLHRYVMTDHYSGAYFVQYHYTPGERAEDVVDFLEKCMAPKGDLATAYPFHGIPRRILMDQGPANKSALVRNLLRSLGPDEEGVLVELHASGNARASGAVETRHKHWQSAFESRLRMLPAEDLDTINAQARIFCAVANSDESRPVTRTLRAARVLAPMALWTRITAEQLREPPPRDVFFQLAMGAAQERTVDARHQISVNRQVWELSGPRLVVGQKVEFRLAPFASEGIRIWAKDGTPLAATRISFDQVSGFPLNGKIRIWDDAAHAGAKHPTQPAEAATKAALATDDAVRMPAVWDALPKQLERHAYLTQPGQAWVTPNTPLAGEPVLGSLEAREELCRRLDMPLGQLGTAAIEWWHAQLAEGVTATQLAALIAEFTRSDVARRHA